MTEVHISMPTTEVGHRPVLFEIWNTEGKVGDLTINKKWIRFRKVNCMNVKRISLEKLPEVFDKLGK